LNQEDANIPSFPRDDYMDCINLDVETSYKGLSSIEMYFKKNCSDDYTFPPSYQHAAIRKLITMECTKKRGILSLAEATSIQSFSIFFAIAQIAFLGNDLVLKYLSIILSLFIPLWRVTFKCQLDIPTSPEQIQKVITSTLKFSVRSLIPMPSVEEINDHCYSSLPSLLAYTTMIGNNAS